MKSFPGWSTSCSVTSSPLLRQMSKPTWACWDGNVVTCPGKEEWDTSQKIFHLTTFVCRHEQNNHNLSQKSGISKTCLPKGSWSTWKAEAGASEWKRNKKTPSIAGNLPYFPPGFTLHLKRGWIPQILHLTLAQPPPPQLLYFISKLIMNPDHSPIFFQSNKLDMA